MRKKAEADKCAVFLFVCFSQIRHSVSFDDDIYRLPVQQNGQFHGSGGEVEKNSFEKSL